MDCRMAAPPQPGLDRRPLRRLIPLEGHENEQAILPVALRIAKRLTGHRNDPGAVLARTLRHQLLDPGAEARHRR